MHRSVQLIQVDGTTLNAPATVEVGMTLHGDEIIWDPNLDTEAPSVGCTLLELISDVGSIGSAVQTFDLEDGEDAN